MFSAVCLLLSSAILFYVLKYRVHLHVSYTRPTSRVGATRKGSPQVSSEPATPQKGSRCDSARKMGRRAESTPMTGVCSTATTRPVPFDSVVWGDITSALVNLGASKVDARFAAKKALLEHAQESFDIQLSAALQNIGRAA